MTAALEERIEGNLSALNYPRCVLHEDEGVTLRDEGERIKFQGSCHDFQDIVLILSQSPLYIFQRIHFFVTLQSSDGDSFRQNDCRTISAC